MVDMLGISTLVAAVLLGMAFGIGIWSRPAVAREFWMSLVLWAVQFGVGLTTAFCVWFLGISTPHCAPNCDWALLSNDLYVSTGLTALIQAASLVLCVVFRRSPRVWIIPVAAIVLILALCVAASFVAYRAMRFF